MIAASTPYDLVLAGRMTVSVARYSGQAIAFVSGLPGQVAYVRLRCQRLAWGSSAGALARGDLSVSRPWILPSTLAILVRLMTG